MAIKRKASTSGFSKYRSFIKTKTKREATKVESLEKQLKLAKKQKAVATKKAVAAYKKLKK